MHFHRLERIWLSIGIFMLVAFLVITGVNAFAMGNQPPTGHHRIDPAKVEQTAPFDKPGLTKAQDGEYDAVIVAYAFGYKPSEFKVPVGATVNFMLTSSDVVHGFEIVGTNVNMMAVPGEMNHTSYTFKKAGRYLVLCNEYCGAGHEAMKMEIIVE